MNFSAVILAGGKSSRMGRDKARLPVDGQPLLARQIQLARDAGATEIFISGRAGEDYSEFGLPILHDRFPDAGPLAGIERALDASTPPLVLVLAVDLANLKVATLNQLQALCASDCGVVPRLGNHIETLTAFYPKSAHTLATRLLMAKAYAVHIFAEACVEAGLAVFHEVDPRDAASFANWNSPADLPHF